MLSSFTTTVTNYYPTPPHKHQKDKPNLTRQHAYSNGPPIHNRKNILANLIHSFLAS
jgi:hypothetical protein